MLDIKELQEKTSEELKDSYKELSKEIFELENEFAMTRKIEKPHLFKAKKRERARILTVLKQKEKKRD